MRNRKRKIISLLVVIFLFCNSAIALASNSSLKEKEKQIQEIEQEYKNASEEVVRLDKEIEKIQNEILTTELKIEELNTEIASCEKSIETIKEEIKDKQEKFGARLRVMYANRSVGYLELLLSSEDIVDFISKLSMTEYMIKHDVELIESIVEKLDKIEEKENKLELKKTSFELIKEDLAKKEKEIQENSEQKQLLIKKLEQDKTNAEKELEELHRKINAQIQTSTRGAQIGNYTGGAMSFPVSNSKGITSHYGPRNGRFHSGIDIVANEGANVIAASNGTVIFSGWSGAYGKTAMISHGGNVVTLYAHNSALLVKPGQKVKRGQVIAEVGSTGRSTGPHLHFEVRVNGSRKNPMSYLSR